jgi:hypothetical protein
MGVDYSGSVGAYAHRPTAHRGNAGHAVPYVTDLLGIPFQAIRASYDRAIPTGRGSRPEKWLNSTYRTIVLYVDALGIARCSAAKRRFKNRDRNAASVASSRRGHRLSTMVGNPRRFCPKVQ